MYVCVYVFMYVCVYNKNYIYIYICDILDRAEAVLCPVALQDGEAEGAGP